MNGRARGDSVEWLLVAVLVAAMAVFVAGRLAAFGSTELTVWGDRDLWRAMAVPHSWPLMGPESNGGLRSPGGAFYLLLAGALALGHGIEPAYFAMVALVGASALLLGLVVARRVSPLAGALSAASLTGSVIVWQAMAMWNPGFILIFATVATMCGYAFLAEGRALSLGLAVGAIALGMQVHLQITQVAIGLALATAVYRPRLTWRHGGAVALGLGIPYLPNILSGGLGLMQNAAALPGDAVVHYVFWQPDWLMAKAGRFATLFAGAADAIGRPEGWVRLPLLAADWIVPLVAAAGIIALLRHRRQAFAGQPAGLFALILLVTAVTALFSDLLTRHMVAVAPAAAALVGVTAEQLRAALRRRAAPVAAIGTVVVAALIAIRPLAFGILGLLPGELPLNALATQQEIVTAIKPVFYGDRDGFESHVAEFGLNQARHWVVVSNGIPNHLSFLYQTDTLPVGADRPECLAVVSKADASGDLRKGLAGSTALSGLGAQIGEPAAVSEHFVYVPYTTRDGNCLKTFPNGYIPTSFEAAHLPAGAPASAHSLDGAALFVDPQPGQRDPLGIEIRREGGAYVAVLHGALLRGYTGLMFMALISPTLCFADDHGAHPIHFANLAVGSAQRGTLAPWRSPVFALPDGRYRVWLIARDGKRPIALRDGLGEVTLPSLEAALPATAEPPPEGCL